MIASRYLRGWLGSLRFANDIAILNSPIKFCGGLGNLRGKFTNQAAYIATLASFCGRFCALFAPIFAD
ncbi:hypothetical protein [Campylobacter rectus]|uniref:hypothetical protein n=1 Tax=Campylobacter rectus TaxID=203 RepID=UPI0028DBCD23|nr:hypothetical protein [Campylobacter rectus]